MEAWGLARCKEGFFIEECQVIDVKGMIELEKSAFSNFSLIIGTQIVHVSKIIGGSVVRN